MKNKSYDFENLNFLMEWQNKPAIMYNWVKASASFLENDAKQEQADVT